MKKAKYKIGDRLRVLESDGDLDEGDFPVGHIFTVAEVSADNNNPIYYEADPTDEDAYQRGAYESEVELAIEIITLEN